MYNEEIYKSMASLFTDPLFKKGFFDFFVKMQMEGIEAARKFWGMHPGSEAFANAPEVFEKMVDFYITLGFVPYNKYEDALKENEKLKAELNFLRNTLHELQVNMFTEAGERAREVWTSIVDKQLDMHKEISRNFFELFKSLKP